MYLRLLPPVDVAKQSITVSGHTYAATPGETLDVPNGDAMTLCANGWILVAAVGTTSQRPTSNSNGSRPLNVGTEYVDTSLGALIVWDGASWRNPATGAAV